MVGGERAFARVQGITACSRLQQVIGGALQGTAGGGICPPVRRECVHAYPWDADYMVVYVRLCTVVDVQGENNLPGKDN